MKLPVRPSKWTLALVGAFALICLGGFLASEYEKYNDQTVKVDSKVLVNGRLVPGRQPLSLPVGGVVAEILVKEGDRVEAGQVLICLENRENTARYYQVLTDYAKVSVNQSVAAPTAPDSAAKQTVKPQNRFADGSKSNYERMQKLYEMGAISRKQFEQAKEAYMNEQSKAAGDNPVVSSGGGGAVVPVAGEFQMLHEKLRQIESERLQMELRASHSGVVAAIGVEVGDYIAAGRPVVFLADFTSWQINVDGLYREKKYF